MPDTVAFFGQKAITGPIPLTRPNIYDKDALIILDPGRLTGASPGVRPAVMARGRAPYAARNFDQVINDSLRPEFVWNGGPDNLGVLDFSGDRSLTTEGRVNINTGQCTIILTIRIRAYGPTSSNLRILEPGDTPGGSPAIRPVADADGVTNPRVAVFASGATGVYVPTSNPNDWKVIGASISSTGPSYTYKTGDALHTRAAAYPEVTEIRHPIFGCDILGRGLSTGGAGDFLLREARFFDRAMGADELTEECQRLESLFGIT